MSFSQRLYAFSKYSVWCEPGLIALVVTVLHPLLLLRPFCAAYPDKLEFVILCTKRFHWTHLSFPLQSRCVPCRCR